MAIREISKNSSNDNMFVPEKGSLIKEEQKQLSRREIQSKKTKEEIAKERATQRAKDMEMVRGVFRHYEIAGHTLKFSFRKWKEIPTERYELEDGCVYNLPAMVVEHLNSNVFTTVHKFMLDERGKPSRKIGKKIRRCGFNTYELIEGLQEDDYFLVDPVERSGIVPM